MWSQQTHIIKPKALFRNYVNFSDEYDQLTRKAAARAKGDIVIVAGSDGVKDTSVKAKDLTAEAKDC